MNKSRTSSDTIEDFSSTLTYIELVIIGTIMISICAVTIIGNAFVMISFMMDKKLRTLSNYFLLSLAVSDVMIAVFSMPLFIAYFLIGEWTFGPVLCDMWLAQDYTCSNASCMNLLMICLDRYFSVTNPLKYRAKKTPKRVGIMIFFVWLISFLLWPPWIYAWPYIEGVRTVPEDDCYIQFFETNSYLTIITTGVDYYIPVTVMCIFYYKIWRATKRRNKYLANMDSQFQTESLCLQKNNSCSQTNTRQHPIEMTVSNNNQNNSRTNDQSTKSTTVPLLVTEEKNGMQCDKYDRTVDEHVKRISDAVPDSKYLNDNTDLNKMPLYRKESIKHDKAARMLSAILLAFIVTTTPANILIMIKHFDTSLVPDSLINFTFFLFYVNSTINPVCYALANENFRKTYWQILTCSWSKRSKYALYKYSNTSSQSKSSSVAKQVTSPV